jgi:hypothetical protein
MMLDIAAQVAARFPVAGASAEALRVAFIRTTDPVFLIFAPAQAHPHYVAKVGRGAALARQFTVEARLHQLLPGAVARPVGVIEIGDGAAVIVHEGAAGLPWFRLADTLHTTHDWLALRERCIAQLRAFASAVAGQPDWVAAPARQDLGLSALAASLHEVIAPLGLGEAWLRDAVAALEALGPVPASWQHGDFVLNNLLVDGDRLTVVDLVDFGKWRVPLLDACALACSLHFHAGTHAPWHGLEHDLAACVAGLPPGGRTADQTLALAVYFLLAAISDTLGRPRREGVRRLYLDLLRDVAGDPSRYRRALADAPG